MTLSGWIVVGVLAIALAIGALGVSRFDGVPPEIVVPERTVIGIDPEPLAVEISDDDAGLRSLEIRLEHAQGSVDLASRLFNGSIMAGGSPGSHHARIDLDLDPETLKLADGPATLHIAVRDWSWRDGFRGNLSESELVLTVDTRAPEIRAEPGLTYVQRGGSGVILYRVNEQTTRDGLRVGRAFFRGQTIETSEDESAGKLRAVVFAIPVEAVDQPTIRLVAEDAAGNAASSNVAIRVKDREFARGEVRLPESFLERVAVPLAEASSIDSSDPVEAFRRVNRDLRASNEEQIRTIVSGVGAPRQFTGAFQQWPNSAVRSGFAEEREYLVGGRSVSEARHYGYDLAATAQAPITAANRGHVAFAGDLGIYGLCVVVNHGMGVHTLYGHLSEISVEVGDAVERGGVLGRSGATGLAGGDHLHFAVLVGGEYVDPIEWWDPRWVETHVDARLGPGPGPSGTGP